MVNISLVQHPHLLLFLCPRERSKEQVELEERIHKVGGLLVCVCICHCYLFLAGSLFFNENIYR